MRPVFSGAAVSVREMCLASLRATRLRVEAISRAFPHFTPASLDTFPHWLTPASLVGWMLTGMSLESARSFARNTARTLDAIYEEEHRPVAVTGGSADVALSESSGAPAVKPKDPPVTPARRRTEKRTP